jgi:hypothetical protein
VVMGETVTVQGMFDRGVVHAHIVSHADGRTQAFGPPPPPPPPPGGPRQAGVGAPPPPPGAPPPPPGMSAPARADSPLQAP